MKRLLSFMFVTLFIVFIVYTVTFADSNTNFKDTSGIGDHGVVIGTSSDEHEPNYLEIYGGGDDCLDDAGFTSGLEHPGYIKLWNGATTSVGYCLWVDSTGDLRIGTSCPGDSNFDQEGSGSVVGGQS